MDYSWGGQRLKSCRVKGKRKATYFIRTPQESARAPLIHQIFNRSYCAQQGVCQLNDKLSYALQALR